jgi:anthranilate synthase component 1
VLVHDRTRQRLSIIHDLEIRAGESVEAAYERGVQALDRVERLLARPTPPQPEVAAEPEKLEPVSNVTRERFVEMVKRCQQYIHAGDIFQVVPSQRFTLPQRCEAFQIYRQLRVLNPSPYLFFMRCGDHVVLGSSPEIHVRLTDGQIELRPLAGTAPRGATPEQDKEIEKRLLSDPKELAEHVMLVDLGRNDVGAWPRSDRSWSTSSRSSSATRTSCTSSRTCAADSAQTRTRSTCCARPSRRAP